MDGLINDHKLYNRFVPTSPTRIQVRDIVEAKLLFLAVPLRGGSFKMMLVLRDLTLLDGNYARVSHYSFLT